METRPYGQTNATATVIGLGGAFLTANSFSDGVATAHCALDLGITYFDTSPMYCQGASQAVFGEALHGRSEEFLLATKLGYFKHPSRFHSREALITQFEENLRLLRRDTVDILQLHEADSHHWWSTDTSRKGRIDPDTDYEFAGTAAHKVLHELKAEGRCRFIGISGNSADGMYRVLQNVEVDTFLLAFNYDLTRRGAREIFKKDAAQNVVRMVGAIFQRGLACPQPNLLESPPNWMTPQLLTIYQQIYDLQKESGMSLATMGVRFMIAQPNISTIIIGAKSPEEIEECVKASEQGPLPDDLVEQIETLGTMP